MNEEQWIKYYALLGIEPPSPAAVVVRNGATESAITEGIKEKVLLPSDAAETKRVESITDHKPTYKEICDAQVVDMKEGEGDRNAQAQELREQTKKTEVEEPAEAEAVEGDADREGDLRESAVDEAAPDSPLFLGSEAADEFEPARATLATAAILPLSLLSNETWVWIFVLVGIAIVGYLFLRWYFRRGKGTSPSKQEPRTVEGFMRDF